MRGGRIVHRWLKQLTVDVTSVVEASCCGCDNGCGRSSHGVERWRNGLGLLGFERGLGRKGKAKRKKW